VIGRVRLETAGQVAVRFSIPYREADLTPGGRYFSTRKRAPGAAAAVSPTDTIRPSAQRRRSQTTEPCKIGAGGCGAVSPRPQGPWGRFWRPDGGGILPAASGAKPLAAGPAHLQRLSAAFRPMSDRQRRTAFDDIGRWRLLRRPKQPALVLKGGLGLGSKLRRQPFWDLGWYRHIPVRHCHGYEFGSSRPACSLPSLLKLLRKPSKS